MAIFAGNNAAYGTHGEPVQNGYKWEIKSTAQTLRGEVTSQLWQRHLDGDVPLGIIAIRSNSTCSWGSIDIDEYEDNLLGVITKLESLQLPLVPCRSKSGGLHLFLFLAEPVPAAAVRGALTTWAAALGFAGSEIFPKQTQVIAEKGDVGNWMVMPYYGSTYGNKIKEQVGLRKAGGEMLLSEFISAAENSRITPAQLQEASKIKGRQLVARNGHAVAAPAQTKGPFADGPPCLQHLVAIGVGEGGRNNTLFQMGVYYKRAHPNEWKIDLENANRDFLDPPVTAQEVLGIVQSLSKEGKEYRYKCKDEPMHSHCDSKLCRLRKFGVGEAGATPIISGLSKLDSDQPIWFVDVEEHRLSLSTIELLQYPKFQLACASKIHRFFANISQADWVEVLAEAAKALVLIDAPYEVGETGRFIEVLEEFLTNRRSASRLEDIHAGMPWLDDEDNRYYFRLRDLHDFLARETVEWRTVTRGQISQLVQGDSIKGGKRQRWITGHNVNLFWVPGDLIKPPVRVEPPALPKEPI